MDYKKHYNNLIEKAKHQNLSSEVYTERHHILPLSIGGSNDPSNIVKLTARQHYFAHKLLVKIYEKECANGKDKTPYYKMLRAFTAMIWFWGNTKENLREPNICSRMYEQWKKDLIEYNRLCSKKWMNSLTEKEKKEYSKKISDSLKKRYAQSGFPWKGKHHSEQSKSKLSIFHKQYHPQADSKNSQYGHHWWKDPNDKTKSLSIKEGDPVPEGWVRGKWQTFSEEGLKNIQEGNKKNIGRFMITNGEVNHWISKNDPIPEGFWKGMRIKDKAYVRKDLQEKKKLTEEELHQIRSAASKRSNETKRKALQEKNYPIIKEQYEFWLDHTWSEFVKKYDYKYTQVNFNNQCKKYLGKEWHPKSNFVLAKS